MTALSLVKPVAKGLQKGINTITPYVLANVGAAAALHSGIEGYDNAYELSEGMKNAGLYGGLAAFNAGVVAPIAREGWVQYVLHLFGKKSDSTSVSVTPNAKTVLLAAAAVAGIAYAPVRVASTAALWEIAGDVSGLLKGKHVIVAPPVDQGGDALQSRITNYVNGLRSRGLARAYGIEGYSILAKDLRSGKVLVDINTNVPRLAASTNKMYVLLAAEHEIANGRLENSAQMENNLKGMIRSSNNYSTDWVIDQIGGEEKVNAIVQTYGFEDTIVEKIRPEVTGGRTLGNKSSAEDLGDFLERLYHGTLPRSDAMRDILSLEAAGHPDRIVDKTCIPEDRRFLTSNGGYIKDVEDKTGYIWGANNDAGIVEAEFFNKKHNAVTDVPYIFAALIEDENAKPDNFRPGSWGPAKSETLRSISESIFWDLQRTYSDIPASCKAHKGVHPQ